LQNCIPIKPAAKIGFRCYVLVTFVLNGVTTLLHSGYRKLANSPDLLV